MGKRREIPNPKPTGVGRRLDRVPVRYRRSTDEGFRIVIGPRRTGMSEPLGLVTTNQSQLVLFQKTGVTSG